MVCRGGGIPRLFYGVYQRAKLSHTPQLHVQSISRDDLRDQPSLRFLAFVGHVIFPSPSVSASHV
jgi:hypothetical protein